MRIATLFFGFTNKPRPLAHPRRIFSERQSRLPTPFGERNIEEGVQIKRPSRESPSSSFRGCPYTALSLGLRTSGVRSVRRRSLKPVGEVLRLAQLILAVVLEVAVAKASRRCGSVAYMLGLALEVVAEEPLRRASSVAYRLGLLT